MNGIASLRIPNNLYFGSGSAKATGDLAKDLDADVVLVISDQGLTATGIVEEFEGWLQGAGLGVENFLDVEAEPSIQSIEPCLEQAKSVNPDVVVAIGGGSVLDTAKAVAMLLTNEGDVERYLGTDLVAQRGVPTILIPTTSGTGAEITPNALFYVPKLRAKKAIVSRHIIPDIAIIDPDLTLSAPPKLTAATGLDALCHAIESYTGLNATPLSEPFAREAIRQITQHLRTAVFFGKDREARNGMALGSLYAAISIANSGTNAVHALAYPLQGLNRVQHGVANSLLLPYVISFNLLGNIQKFAEVASLMGVPTAHMSLRDAAACAAEACRKLSEDIGIPQHMKDVSVREDQLDELVEGALEVQRLLKNNPRPIQGEDIRRIYKEAM
jgi:alcohol dehydrogenase class IV